MTSTISSRKKSATYQDQWVNGQAAAAGYRECASRYEIIRDFCRNFDRPVTVCDIGANMCYFGLRLTEDFPQCSVMGFEFDHFELREAHVRRNKAERLLLLNRKLTLSDVRILKACCRFDVVIALSVMHHLGGGTFDEWLKALRGLGRNLLAEFAIDDSDTSISCYNSSVA